MRLTPTLRRLGVLLALGAGAGVAIAPIHTSPRNGIAWAAGRAAARDQSHVPGPDITALSASQQVGQLIIATYPGTTPPHLC